MNKKINFIAILLLLGSTISCKNNTNQNSGSVNNSNNSSIISNSSSTSISNEDYGELIIPDMEIYTNFPDAPQPMFTKPEYASEITYTILDESIISYNDGYFSATDEDVIYVDATTKYHSTTFEVSSKIYTDQKEKFYLNRVDTIEDRWIEKGRPTGGTLFIGDSFFDTEFFSNFYEIFEDGTTFTHGVSSSTTTDWEIFASRLLFPVKPKNIVMHLGTNNLFDDKEDSETALFNIQILLEKINERLPETNIYYFAIEPRTYGIGTTTFNQASYNTIKEVNEGMIEYCETFDYVKFLDATSYCYTNGKNVNSDFFRDGCHPKLNNYSVYLNLLKDAGLELSISEEFTNTKEFKIQKTNGIGQTNKLIVKDGEYITNNYQLSGKFKVLDTGTNSHIQFSFDSTNNKNRFLLWDEDSDGVLKPAYAINGDHNASSGNANIYKNQEYLFEVVATTKNTYFYIDGILEFVFANVYAKEFMIGAENTEVEFYNINVVTNKEVDKWSNIINSDEISQYEEDTTNVVRAIIV